MSPILRVPLVCLLAALPAFGQSTLLRNLDGPGGSRLGSGVAVIRDVDGDQMSEVVVAEGGSGVYSAQLTLLSGATGAPLWSVPSAGLVQGRVYGSHLRTLNDVDGDGVEELLVGSANYSWTDNGPLYPDRVDLHSGATGQLLWTNSANWGDVGHFALRAIDDLDGDGTEDFAVGGYTQLTVYSGATRQVITNFGAAAGAWRIFDVAPAGDQNGDGTPDVLLSYSDQNGLLGSVHSGANGNVIATIVNPLIGTGWPTTLARVGDHDGDGADDFAFGLPYSSAGAPYAGAVVVTSGTSGNVIRQWIGTQNYGRYGHLVQRLPDVDADGVEDLMIGQPDLAVFLPPTSGLPGGLEIRSGVTGNLLFDLDGASLGGGHLGWTAAPFADVTGNGVPELLVGLPAYATFNPYIARGRVALISLGDALGPCAASTVGGAAGLPSSPLTVNGQTGGLTARVPVSPGTPITLATAWPPSHPQAPRFALWVRLGTPTASDVFTTPVFDLCFSPAGPSTILLYDGFGGPALLPFGIAPAALTVFAPQVPVTLSLCGVMEAPGGLVNGLERLNAVLIDVR